MKSISKIIIVVLIVLVLAAVIAGFVFGLEKLPPAQQQKEQSKEKNPNIKYFNNGILKISGKNSVELAANLGEVNGIDRCRMYYNQPLSVATENNTSYVLVAIGAGCASNFE